MALTGLWDNLPGYPIFSTGLKREELSYFGNPQGVYPQIHSFMWKENTRLLRHPLYERG
jgi:hypothetical protein